MSIPTEPIGSIPRPGAPIEAASTRDPMDPALEALYDEAIKAFAKIRSRVIGAGLAAILGVDDG
ncbi:hypothetical protein [Sorangium sp. So ce388]|uniref:hypothetical protein n=1 Tax=Sorangium sp. So ce388 TaxID=3133309 RepID=UPI003F5BC9A2